MKILYKWGIFQPRFLNSSPNGYHLRLLRYRATGMQHPVKFPKASVSNKSHKKGQGLWVLGKKHSGNGSK